MNCTLPFNEKMMRLVLICHDGLLFNLMTIVYLKQCILGASAARARAFKHIPRQTALLRFVHNLLKLV